MPFDKSIRKPEKTRDTTLKGLGYLSGSEEMPEQTGLIRYDENKTSKGYNFYCGGNGPEAYLTSLDGKRLHKWSYSWGNAFSNASPPRDGIWDPESNAWWRNCFLEEDGDVIALFEGWGLIKIDNKSNLLWKKKESFHHDLERHADKFYVLSRKKSQFKKKKVYRTTIAEDFIVVLNQKGEELQRYSIYKAIIQSDYPSLIAKSRGSYNRKGAGIVFRTGDPLHTNSLQILEEDNSFVRSVSDFDGEHVLVSFRNIDSIALIALEPNRVVWAAGNFFQAQHDTQLLSSGNILLFDNWGKHTYRISSGMLRFEEKRSRILEFNPNTQRIIWSYSGKDENPFYSKCCGMVQRLGNGNTLIVSTQSGRALEVTQDKEIVWEFRNPHEAVEDDRKIANLFKLKRVSIASTRSWLNR